MISGEGGDGFMWSISIFTLFLGFKLFISKEKKNPDDE